MSQEDDDDVRETLMQLSILLKRLDGDPSISQSHHRFLSGILAVLYDLARKTLEENP